jgi:type IV secretion system protein TrbG
MDARRLLIPLLAGLLLGGCATLSGLRSTSAAPATAAPAAVAAQAADDAVSAAPPPPARSFATMAPIPDPPSGAVPRRAGRSAGREPSPATGPAAIAAANAGARETSRARAFVGGVQVFAYDPGRVYEVWTAPLRVTTLTLSPGESIVSKAAGDTVRWQIGETRSGEGPSQRAHVMVKPLERGLETNLVLATSRRVYLIQLRSGAPDAFNAAVTWDLGSVLETPAAPAPDAAAAPGLVAPQGPLDAGFRISPRGRRPAWTPQAVLTDGVRTFLSFPPGVAAGEAPALFARSPNGETRLVNYRQQGDLWVVDQVLQSAELRLGGRRAQVVRIDRAGGPS